MRCCNSLVKALQRLVRALLASLLLASSYRSAAGDTGDTARGSGPDLDIERIPGMRTPCFHTPDSGRFDDYEDGIRCLPINYIIGLPKAGTSALWQKLGYNDYINVNNAYAEPMKEYCFNKTVGSDLTRQDILDWAYRLPSPEDLGSDQLLLNGCIDFFKEIEPNRCVGRGIAAATGIATPVTNH